jgi:serine/threonine protein kinase
VGDASLGRFVAGRYELVGVLGEGTFGVVYDAVHRVIGRRVAVKLLREEIGRDPELVQRFQLEARAAGALGHPNIVQIFDAGQMEDGSGAHFLVMERVEGDSLASEIVRGPLPIARAVDIAAQVLSGLAAAHRRGIVHRDLKPENILIGSDEEGREIAKITDFGISKVLDPTRLGVPTDVRMTGLGEVLGTPLYMAPEQAAGEADVDHRADLWAVGCVLYEMVCGRPPFLGESFPQILAALLRDPPLMPGTLRAEISPALEHAIMTALTKDRAGRPADASAMRAMLLASASGQAARPPARAPAETGASEAALVAALSRAVELELAADASPPAAEPEIELAPVAPATPTPRASRTSRAHTPPPDVFAPPDAVNLPLALEVDRGLLRTSQPGTVVESPLPAYGMSVARRRFPIAGLLSALIIIGILAGAGLAGYRYLTLGYVWRPGSGALKFELAIAPADAEVMLDGEPLESNTFTVEDGTRHELVAKAPGRLALRRELVGAPEMVRKVDIRLANALRPLAVDVPPAASAEPLPAPSGTAADLDQALIKLDLYRACLALVAPDLAKGADAAAAGSPAEPLPATEVDQCRADIERAGRLTPSLGPVDAAANAFIDAVGELNGLARRMRADGRKAARRNQEALVDAYELAETRAAALLVIAERSTSDWQDQELRFVPNRDTAHDQLRRLALAARRRAIAAIQPSAEDVTAAGAGLERALAAARAGDAARPGPAADLVALVAARPSDGAPRADWIAWHDRVVAQFNRLETR